MGATNSMDTEKLKRLQQQAQANRIGGKGTPRRKVQVKKPAAGGGDDKKLNAALKKLNVQAMPGIEEINMFKDDGNVIHFQAPKVHAAAQSNTYGVYGHGEEKPLTELMPGILGQMGPDSMNVLRKMAEQLQLGGQGRPDGAEAAAAGEKEADEQDVDADEPPELVPAAEDADKQKGGSLDDLS